MSTPEFRDSSGARSANLSRSALAVAIALCLATVAGDAGQDEPAGAGKAAGPREDATRALLRRALGDAEGIEDVEDRAHALAEIGAAQARTGDRDAARATFRRAIGLCEGVNWDDAKRMPHVLQEIAYYQAEAGSRDEGTATARTVLQIAEAGVKREDRKVNFYTNLVHVQTALHDEAGVRETIAKGRAFFNASRDPDVRSWAARTFVDLRLYAGDLAGALRVARDPALDQDRFNPGSFRRHSVQMILDFIGPGDDVAARPVIDEARRDVEAMAKRHGRWNVAQELGRIARAEAALGRFDVALETARSMTVEGPPRGELRPRPDPIDGQRFEKAKTFATIAQRLVVAGDKRRAREAAGEAIRVVSTIEQEEAKGVPLEDAAEALALAGDLPGALRSIELTEPARRFWAFLRVNTGLRESGDEAGARATVEAGLSALRTQFDDREPPADPEKASDRKDAHLWYLGFYQAMLGHTDEAIATLRRIRNAEARREVQALIAAERAAAHDPDGALKLIEEIDPATARAEALTRVIQRLPARREAGPGSGAKPRR